MTTRDEAFETIVKCLSEYYPDAYHKEMQEAYASIVISKLIAYGIHPNAIKVAFTTEVKKDVDQTNESR